MSLSWKAKTGLEIAQEIGQLFSKENPPLPEKLKANLTCQIPWVTLDSVKDWLDLKLFQIETTKDPPVTASEMLKTLIREIKCDTCTITECSTKYDPEECLLVANKEIQKEKQ